MDKRDFLNWLFERYYVREDDIYSLAPRYANGMFSDTDFYRLKSYVDMNCRTLPSVYDLNRIIKSNSFQKNVKCEALLHIEDIKRTPKLDFEKAGAEYCAKIKEKLAKIGIKSKIKALQ